MKARHIYWFAHYNPEGPCVRYRGMYALRAMQEQGRISYSFVYPGYRPSNILHFMRVYLSALLFRKKGSWIVFQKIHSRGFYATALRILLRLRPKRTVYDIDDALYALGSDRTIRHFMRHSAHCTVGSKALAEYARKLNSQVHLFTSPVIPHESTALHPRGEAFRIGWIGFYNDHRNSLRELVFPEIIRLDFPVKLILLGVNRPEQREEVRRIFSGADHVELCIPEDIDWFNEADVYRRIAEFDIGLSPLLDTEVNRAKSAFKLKQCLSCAVPVLGSPIGENLRFLRHEAGGLLCSDAAAFGDGLRRFRRMSDAEYLDYRRRARGGCETFGMEAYTDKWAGLLSIPLPPKQNRPLPEEKQAAVFDALKA